jgi:hypothetical protein
VVTFLGVICLCLFCTAATIIRQLIGRYTTLDRVVYPTIGYLAAVIVRLRTIPSEGRKIAEAVAQLECCAFSGLTLGRFDVLIYLIGQTRQELAHVIDEHIAPLRGVVEIDVREPVGSAKQRFDLVFIN